MVINLPPFIGMIINSLESLGGGLFFFNLKLGSGHARTSQIPMAEFHSSGLNGAPPPSKYMSIF